MRYLMTAAALMCLTTVGWADVVAHPLSGAELKRHFSLGASRESGDKLTDSAIRYYTIVNRTDCLVAPAPNAKPNDWLVYYKWTQPIPMAVYNKNWGQEKPLSIGAQVDHIPGYMTQDDSGSKFYPVFYMSFNGPKMEWEVNSPLVFKENKIYMVTITSEGSSPSQPGYIPSLFEAEEAPPKDCNKMGPEQYYPQVRP